MPGPWNDVFATAKYLRAEDVTNKRCVACLKKENILSRPYYYQEKPNMSIIILLHHYQDEIDFNTVQINPLDQSDDAVMNTRHSIKVCWVVKPLRPKNFTLSRDMSQASIGQWIYLSQGPQEISWSLRIHNPIHPDSQRGFSEI